MTVNRAELAGKLAKARASLISRGGQATLRFSVSSEHGYQATNSRLVSDALCALWNAAPELLGIALDPVIQPSLRMSERREPPAETEGDCA
jgi:hypothetical protein